MTLRIQFRDETLDTGRLDVIECMTRTIVSGGINRGKESACASVCVYPCVRRACECRSCRRNGTLSCSIRINT